MAFDLRRLLQQREIWAGGWSGREFFWGGGGMMGGGPVGDWVWLEHGLHAGFSWSVSRMYVGRLRQGRSRSRLN